MPAISLNSLICSAVGIWSDMPVTLPSPCSKVVTSPAASGSVTVPNTTGLSFMAFARAIATGVAIPTATSTFSALYLFAIWAAVFTSPLAFCRSKSASMPASFIASIMPFSTSSRATCWTIFAMPILTFPLFESFAPPAKIQAAINAAKIDVKNLFIVVSPNRNIIF